MARYRHFDVLTLAPDVIESARQRRVELHGAVVSLEQALAAPAPGRPAEWAAAVRGALMWVRAELTDHIVGSEAPDGVLADVLATSPRLANQVEEIRADHGVLADEVTAGLTLLDAGPGDDPSGWVAAVRERVTELLGRIVRHRQCGADLLFAAYAVDIGGES